MQQKLHRLASFHVMTKPVGPICNLDCKYCFYLEKEAMFSSKERFHMSNEVLNAYVRDYICAQNSPEITFSWQGGEPTLLGIDFYRQVIRLQERYADDRKIRNAIQTNGTLLDDEWCEFLTQHNFLVGISIDGPEELHDKYRMDKSGRPSFNKVMRGIELLKKYGTEFNTMTVVNRDNSLDPLKVYHFLKEIGSIYLQFIPLVERSADTESIGLGLDLAMPPRPEDGTTMIANVTGWSVRPDAYGDFLIDIFDEWVRNDVGKTFVQFFEVAFGNWTGMGSSTCVFSPTCGTALALEHNGDLYTCDHYVYPEYRLGNILEQPLSEMVNSPRQYKFGKDKADTLPEYCRSCEVYFACYGECPKHRFLKTPEGEPGLNYLCAAYMKIFHYMDPYMRTMGDLLRNDCPAALIMDWIREQDLRKKGNEH